MEVSWNPKAVNGKSVTCTYVAEAIASEARVMRSLTQR